MHINIKDKKNRDNRWLKRQFNDPYVAMAQREGYRSRAAFKLLEIEKKHHLIRGAKSILDLGCAPGSWLQVIKKHNGKLVWGIDLLEIEPIADVRFIRGDFNDYNVQNALPPLVDLILSDIAPNTTGHQSTDHLRIMSILSGVVEFAESRLSPRGSMAMKIFQGSEIPAFVKCLRGMFQKVSFFKPISSRKESPEIYLVCLDKK